MKINKKVLAILTGLTVGMSSTAFAAMADSFTDVPKDTGPIRHLITSPKRASSTAWATTLSRAAVP